MDRRRKVNRHAAKHPLSKPNCVCGSRILVKRAEQHNFTFSKTEEKESLRKVGSLGKWTGTPKSRVSEPGCHGVRWTCERGDEGAKEGADGCKLIDKVRECLF